MKNNLLTLLAISLVAAVLAGCGGGGPSTTSTTGSNNGSGNAILSGNYVFTISAVTNEKAENPTQVFIAGVFAADGKGTITGGEEDTNQNAGGSVAKDVKLTGTYSIGTDGRGTMNLSANGTTNTFAFVIESAGHGQIIFFNNATNGFGTFDAQTATTVPAANYAFGFNGFDNAKGPQSRVGFFPVASGGGVANGVSDLNDDGTYTQMAVTGSLGSSDSSGRGTATLTTPQLNGNGSDEPVNGNYSYYVISPSRVVFLETDGNGVFEGEADVQTSSSFTASNVSGNYVLSFSGDSSNGPVAVAAQFAADGIGTVTSGDVTENIAGTYVVGSSLTGTFGFATGVEGLTANGRGTFMLTLPDAQGSTDQFVFYMVSPAQMYVMEIDTSTTGELMSGEVLGQAGQPFSAASLTGNYGLQFSGVDSGGAEWDFSGQFAPSGTSTITGGTIDANAGKDQLISNYTSSNALSGAAYSVANTLGRGALNLPISGTTFGLTYYFVSNSQLVLIETDSTGLTSTGAAQIQPAIP